MSVGKSSQTRATVGKSLTFSLPCFVITVTICSSQWLSSGAGIMSSPPALHSHSHGLHPARFSPHHFSLKTSVEGFFLKEGDKSRSERRHSSQQAKPPRSIITIMTFCATLLLMRGDTLTANQRRGISERPGILLSACLANEMYRC